MDVGPGDEGDRPVATSGDEPVERIDAAPAAMPTETAESDVPRLAHMLRSSTDRTVSEEAIECCLPLPHREQCRAMEVCSARRIVAAGRPEEPPEPQAGDAGQAQSIGAQPGQRDRSPPWRLADQVERCDPIHRLAMVARRAARNDVQVSTWFSTPIDVIVVAVVGYLIGSIPVANLVAARQAAVDLRDVGDKNPGYWNAKESLGRRAALPVFVGDVAKGAAAAGVGALLADPGVWGIAYVGGGAAMVGHAFPVFAGFRGGRSVLTFVGAGVVYAPLPALASVGVLVVVLAATRSFAWAARIGIIAFPILQLVLEGPYRTAATGVLMSFIGARFAMAAIANGTTTPRSR